MRALVVPGLCAPVLLAPVLLARVMLATVLAMAALGNSGAAEAQGLRDRIERLAAPDAPVELYADDIAADLDRIEREALFASGAAIVMFTGPGCDACAKAEAALFALTRGLGVGLSVLDTANPEAAETMARLTLDALPSYVLPDKLVRGDVPGFVLERYLTE